MTGKHTHDRRAGAATLTPISEESTPGGWWGLPTLPETLTERLDEQTAMFAVRMRDGLLAASVAIGLDVLDELLQAEVTSLAGPKGRHDPDRSHVRHGTVAGTVTLGGRQVAITRPRVRTADDTGEASLSV